MAPDPVRGQHRGLPTFQDCPHEIRREEGEGQHLAEVLNGDAIAGGDGGKVVTAAQGVAPNRRPCHIRDQDIVSVRLSYANDQTGFNAAAALSERQLYREYV